MFILPEKKRFLEIKYDRSIWWFIKLTWLNCNWWKPYINIPNTYKRKLSSALMFNSSTIYNIFVLRWCLNYRPLINPVSQHIKQLIVWLWMHSAPKLLWPKCLQQELVILEACSTSFSMATHYLNWRTDIIM